MLLGSWERPGNGKYNREMNSIRPNRSNTHRLWLFSHNHDMGREKSKLVESTNEMSWGQIKHENSWFLESRKLCPRQLSPNSAVWGMRRRDHGSQGRRRSTATLITHTLTSMTASRDPPHLFLLFIHSLCVFCPVLTPTFISLTVTSVNSGQWATLNSWPWYFLHLKAGASVG